MAVIGWEGWPDLRGVATREQLVELCVATYPDAQRNTIL